MSPTSMRPLTRVRRTAIIAAALAVAVTGCTSSSTDSATPSQSASATATPSAGQGPPPMTESPAPSPSDLPPPETVSSPSVSVDAKTPVAKAGREGQPSTPTITADPVDPAQPIVYPDKVSLAIDDVSFGVETDKGPGAFPGREYAIITISMANGSTSAINLDTAVVTVLDNTNNPVAQVFPREVTLMDLTGTLEPGSSTIASYAFAVPSGSRSQVTVVVDFDAIHTSAVFRGGIG